MGPVHDARHCREFLYVGEANVAEHVSDARGVREPEHRRIKYWIFRRAALNPKWMELRDRKVSNRALLVVCGLKQHCTARNTEYFFEGEQRMSQMI